MPSSILIYQDNDNNIHTEVQLENETVWLSQGQLADLFKKTKQNISLHIRNIFNEGELDEHSVVKDSLIIGVSVLDVHFCGTLRRF